MRISVACERNNLFVDWPCILCGEHYELDETVQHLVIDGQRTEDMVCEHCAAELKAGKTTRITNHVFQTIDQIQWLTTIADAVANAEDDARPDIKPLR